MDLYLYVQHIIQVCMQKTSVQVSWKFKRHEWLRISFSIVILFLSILLSIQKKPKKNKDF